MGNERQSQNRAANDEHRASADGLKTFAAQIAEGFEQSERGDLVDSDEAIRILQARREKRRII
jgi:hypothetical protein